MKYDLDLYIARDFQLKEFVISNFYNDEQQQRVIESLTDDVIMNIVKLSAQLQVLRDYIGKPIHINIAFRPVWWEHLQGRSGNSQHTLGKAGDIRVEEVTPQEVKEIIEELISKGNMLQGGLSAYNTFTHYDHRKTKARW